MCTLTNIPFCYYQLTLCIGSDICTIALIFKTRTFWFVQMFLVTKCGTKVTKNSVLFRAFKLICEFNSLSIFHSHSINIVWTSQRSTNTRKHCMFFRSCRTANFFMFEQLWWFIKLLTLGNILHIWKILGYYVCWRQLLHTGYFLIITWSGNLLPAVATICYLIYFTDM